MNVSTEVRSTVLQYVQGTMTLESLRDWQVKQFLHRYRLDLEDQKFLAEFEGRYSELLAGLPVEVFKEMLSALVDQRTTLSHPTPQVWLLDRDEHPQPTMLESSAPATRNANPDRVEPRYSTAEAGSRS